MNRNLIQQQNDKFRQESCFNEICKEIPGQVTVSQGVNAWSQSNVDLMQELLLGIATCKQFEEDNDPYGEHDFGAVTIGKAKFFWKISYYDRDYEYLADDPTDLAQCRRGLHIMMACEY